MMMRKLVWSSSLVLSCSSFAFAEAPIQSLVRQLDATAPTALCLAKSDGCAIENSASLKAMKIALDHNAASAVASLVVNEEVADAKAKGLRTTTDRFQNPKVREAGAAAIAAQLGAYRDAFSSEKAAAAITAAARTIGESIVAFAAIETEAKGVTTGRDAYLKGRQSDFAAMRAKISAAVAAVRPYAESEARLAATLNGAPADPRNVFENTCGFGAIFSGAAVDLVADFDFISRLTNSRNLKITCKDTSDYFMHIGSSSKSKYNEKTHTLNFKIGTAKSGNWNSKTVYAYTSFSTAYAELKKSY